MKTLPLGDDTKRRLEDLRPRGMTFDQAVKAILATRPMEEWKELLDAKPSRDVAVVLSRLAQRAGSPSMRRDPSEQVLLAQSAAQRWRMWMDAGRVTVGPGRKWTYRTKPQGGPRVNIRRVR